MRSDKLCTWARTHAKELPFYVHQGSFHIWPSDIAKWWNSTGDFSLTYFGGGMISNCPSNWPNYNEKTNKQTKSPNDEQILDFLVKLTSSVLIPSFCLILCCFVSHWLINAYESMIKLSNFFSNSKSKTFLLKFPLDWIIKNTKSFHINDFEKSKTYGKCIFTEPMIKISPLTGHL